MKTAEEIIELVKKIPTYILDDDIRLYHKYASELPEGSVILDVGTGMAKSAVALAASNPQAIVYTVDNGHYPVNRNWVTDVDDYWAEIESTLVAYGVSRNVLFTVDDFENYMDPTIVTSKGPEEIDLFHLDGEKEQEEKILAIAYPRVVPGGILLLRNHNRFADTIKEICTDCDELEIRGEIKVLCKRK